MTAAGTACRPARASDCRKGDFMTSDKDIALQLDHALRLIDSLKAYLTAIDMHADESVMYWQNSCANAPEDSERAFKLIIAKEVSKNNKQVVKNLFRFIEEASKTD